MHMIDIERISRSPRRSTARSRNSGETWE